jgi:hypothetical protein
MWGKQKKTPERSLYDIFQSLDIEQYKKTILQERYLSVLANFYQRSITLAYMFYITRIIVTVGSILVPAFLSIQGSTFQLQIYWATWVLSLSVTISNGFMTLFKIDKKYFFINTTLELLYSEGWQYVGWRGRYSGKDGTIPTHENQFLVFFHMAEKIKMRQVEEEYWKFTDTSGVGNATNQKGPLISPTPMVQQGQLSGGASSGGPVAHSLAGPPERGAPSIAAHSASVGARSPANAKAPARWRFMSPL